MIKFKIGQQVVWVPSEAHDPDWGRNDEWNNEFTWSANRALTDQEMDEYIIWSDEVQHGTITTIIEDEGFVQIRLLEPFGIFNQQMQFVTYPWDADLGEYWTRVQESSDYYPFRCSSPDASAGFVYLCKELDCPKHGERNKEWKNEADNM